MTQLLLILRVYQKFKKGGNDMTKKLLWILVIVLVATTFTLTAFASESDDSLNTYCDQSFGVKKFLGFRLNQGPLEKGEMREFRDSIDPSMTKEEILAKATEFVAKKVTEGKLTQEQADAILKRMENCPAPGQGPKQNLTEEQKKEILKTKVNMALENGVITQEQAAELLDKIEKGEFEGLRFFKGGRGFRGQGRRFMERNCNDVELSPQSSNL